jgi:hypothetical protein
MENIHWNLDTLSDWSQNIHPVAQQEILLKKMNQDIMKRKNLLIKKKKDLEDRNDNEYLNSIKSYCGKICKELIKDKQKELEAFIMLRNYLDNLKKEKKVHGIEGINIQKELVEKELKKIQKDLDNLLMK